MIRNIFKVLPTICLTILLGLSNCGKPGNTPVEKADIAQELIQKLNNIPAGVTFKVEPADITVEPTGNGRYLITFKNPSTTIDTSIFKQLNMGLPLKDEKIPIKTEELVYKYGPEEKYLEMVAIKRLYFEWNLSKTLTVPCENKTKPIPDEMTVWFSLGSAAFHNYNLSPLLDTKAKNLPELLAAMLKKTTSLIYRIDNLDYGVRLEQNKKKMSFHVEAEKIEGSHEVLAEVFISLYIKNTPPPDLAKILKQGTPLLNLGMKCSSLKLSVSQDGILLGEGIVKDMDISYFLKPDKNKSFFVYGFNWDMKDLKLTVPGNKDLEMAGNVEEMKMKFSLENLSTSFVEAYFNLARKSMEMSATMDKEKIQQQQMVMGMTIAAEFIKSQPVIKCSISPLKHYFGELEADIDFKFFNLMAPVGKAVVNFPKVEETLTKIKTLLTDKTAETVMKMAQDYISIDEQGNGRMTFETKQEQPGKFFLNGTPVIK